MLFTESISDELLDILMPYTEWFFAQNDHDILAGPEEFRAKRAGGLTWETATDEKYLEHIRSKGDKHIGFPETVVATDMSQMYREPWFPSQHHHKQQELNSELIAFLGARNVAVHTYYPPGGFMGWHTNHNATGYNILLTYNPVEGGGFFRWYDYVNDEILTLPDPVGWSCKVGYYGTYPEKDSGNMIYHCCGNTEKRLTFGYIVPHLDIWQSMIEDISGKDASHFGKLYPD